MIFNKLLWMFIRKSIRMYELVIIEPQLNKNNYRESIIKSQKKQVQRMQIDQVLCLQIW